MFIKATILVLNIFAGVLLFPLSVSATHSDSAQYGTAIFTGHFGQPHDEVVSGEFNFIVSTDNVVDGVEFLVVKGADVNNPLTRGSYTSVSSSGNEKYFSYVWNSTGYGNGDYRLYADISCDSCFSNNQPGVDTVFHYDGKNYLAFIVENPVIEPQISQPDSSQQQASFNCEDKIKTANTLKEQIIDKNNSKLLFIDNFRQQAIVFSQNNNVPINNEEDANKTISSSRKSASDILVRMIKTEFICDSTFGDQVSNFVSLSEDFRNNSDTYKDDVIKYILKIFEAS